MKRLVGELVDISGKVVSRDKKPGAITIDVSGGEADVEVEVESGTLRPKTTVTKVATTKTFADPAAADSQVELSRPVYRINVESVKASGLAAGSSCR
jgi:hypothetical protein